MERRTTVLELGRRHETLDDGSDAARSESEPQALERDSPRLSSPHIRATGKEVKKNKRCDITVYDAVVADHTSDNAFFVLL